MSQVRANSITNAAGTGAPDFPNGLTAAAGASLASPTFTGVASFPDGTATAPSITNTGDTNTGIYFPNADKVSIAAAGVEQVRVESGGVLFRAGTLTLGDAAYPSASPILNFDLGGGYNASIAYFSDLEFYSSGPGGDRNIVFYSPTSFQKDVTFVKAIRENVYALTGTTPALDPSNGTIQTWTLSANSAPTDSLNAGESMTLMIDDGTARTVTWPSVTWETGNGTAPTLDTSGFTTIVLWKVGSTLYGARVGG